MQNKSSKKLIIIAIIVILMLCSCCCLSSFIALGVAGSLPKSIQKTYDENDWYWDKYVDENKDSVEGNYPNGDIKNWWWTATDAERQSYIDENGYPYSLYSFDWESEKFDDGSWYNETDCVFPNGDAKDWWYTIDNDMRQCYIYLHGLPSFVYEDEGEWEETGWYNEKNCDFPNSDAENWWDSASDAMKDCYTWTYGLPDFLYSDLYYEDDYE